MKCSNYFRPFFRDVLKTGKNACMKYDKLIIDKEAYMYDEETEHIKKCTK